MPMIGLPKGHIQRTESAADRGGQGAFDGHAIRADSVEGFFRQRIFMAILGLGFFPGRNFPPGYPPFAGISISHRCIQNGLGGCPDVRADAIPFDKWDDGKIGCQRPILRIPLNNVRWIDHYIGEAQTLTTSSHEKTKKRLSTHKVRSIKHLPLFLFVAVVIAP